MAHHSRWRARFSRQQLTKEGLATQRDDFNEVSSPSEWITRARAICLLTAPLLLRYRLLAMHVEMPLHQSNTNAVKDALKPLRFL